ncbi:hypothetical protein [Neobacillus drentensis]
MLKPNVDFATMLIGAEGARLLREYGAEEAPRNARGKHAHGAEINRQV